MSDTAPLSPMLLQRVRWPIFVVALLGGHCAMLIAVMAYAYALVGNGALESTAYEDGLAWDQLQSTRRASRLLGWNLAVAPSAIVSSTGERRVVFELRDAHRAPIRGAELEVRFYHHTRAGDVLRQTLRTDQNGACVAELSMRLPGLWRLRADAACGGQSWMTETDLWIAPVEGASPPTLSRTGVGL